MKLDAPAISNPPAARNAAKPAETPAPGMRPSRRVTIVEGAGRRLSDQTRLLLRARLRLVSVVIFVGAMLFLIWGVVTGNFPLTTPRGYLSWLHLAMIGTTAWAGVELWRPRLMSWRGLRTAEIGLFGMPALLILGAQYVQMTDPGRITQVRISSGAWSALIFTYAMFVPNPWRRAARIIGTMALAPIVLAIIAHRQAAGGASRFWEELSGNGLLLVLVAGVATYGTHVINALRRQAFEARQLGQYRLRELLGSGGMGDVWLAEHQLLKRPCAIKLIDAGKSADPRAQSRFEREVRATARLSHWNTVEIFDYGRTDEGTFYYVMEYLPGLSLMEIVETHGPLPAERAIYLLRQACCGLREAHAQGLIHRDIKPSNMIAAFRGGLYDVVKVVDFGLVELMSDPVATWNADELFAGSPYFVSPEQALGGAASDARNDIYSLGAVAYYLVTGRPPFEGTKPIKIVIAHAHDPVTPPRQIRPELPADLDAVILRCLAKDPADRFQTVGDLEAALGACGVAAAWTDQSAEAWWQKHEPEAVRKAEALGLA
ncbi:MAG: serine/threonine protein kinase [Pirellulales bacterium]|nr:serine/threonine protein kinase [Pirellulales bacterium]